MATANTAKSATNGKDFQAPRPRRPGCTLPGKEFAFARREKERKKTQDSPGKAQLPCKKAQAPRNLALRPAGRRQRSGGGQDGERREHSGDCRPAGGTGKAELRLTKMEMLISGTDCYTTNKSTSLASARTGKDWGLSRLSLQRVAFISTLRVVGRSVIYDICLSYAPESAGGAYGRKRKRAVGACATATGGIGTGISATTARLCRTASCIQ